MPKIKVSLENWATLRAVVETGSFAAAAEQLNKSQSSISYAIARLNQQLPEPVLQLKGRRAVLTVQGKVLYRRALALLEHAQRTEDYAQQLAQGIESQVSIALDALIDIQAIIPALDALAQEYPLTRVRILETSLSGTEEALLERQADIVIGSKVPTGFSGVPIKNVEMIPVAHPSHPLLVSLDNEASKAIDEWQLKAHRQIVLRDTGTKREQDAGWLGSEQRWTVSHFASSLKILRSGIGFAFMPLNWVEDDLKRGTLQRLPLEQDARRIVPLYLMLSSPEKAGPVTQALAKALKHAFEQ
ncbi:MAG: LysR family transcriptional regulator [Pseudohongiellaceae bacterium]|nr:LysR family transcriptional regulator [Pseudohongiellaceae bacterium]